MSASIANQKPAWEDDSQHQDVQTDSEAGIDGYLLWEDTRPNRDTKESGDKENEVMKLVIQHLSAVTLAGEELGPWPETSPRLLSDLMGRKWSEVRTRFLDFQRNVGDRKAVRKLPSPAMASEVSDKINLLTIPTLMTLKDHSRCGNTFIDEKRHPKNKKPPYRSSNRAGQGSRTLPLGRAGCTRTITDAGRHGSSERRSIHTKRPRRCKLSTDRRD
jgi:hypothetical protein